MPKVAREISFGVTVISARDKYEKLYPTDFQRWKVEAFLDTKKELDGTAITNIVALGDNIFEIEAAVILGKQFKKAYIKTIKFR